MDNQNPIPPKFLNHSTALKILIIVFVILGFVTSFGGGFYLKGILKEEIVTSSPKPSSVPVIAESSPSPGPDNEQPLIQNGPGLVGEEMKFLPGKHYFDDTVIAVTKNEPHYSLVATVARQENDKDYAQNSRVSYFDGKSWVRKMDVKSTPSSTIIGNPLVKSWTNKIDSSRVLKEIADGEINIENSKILFSTGILQNEIGMRSLPGYTKFLSKGEGILNINGSEHPAYILYSRTYSLNSSEIQFYDQPFGVFTDWLVFWDKQGNMYHLDATDVPNPTLIYQTHKIAILDNSENSVLKTFQLNITRDSLTPPSKYTINLGAPINQSLTLNLLNSINKAPNDSFKWYMGQVKGTVQNGQGKNVEGIGLVEYIRD